MHFSLAKFIAAVPLLASATPLAHSTHVKIPVSKRSNLQRDHGSVNIKALKASVAATTAKISRGFDTYQRNTGERHPSQLDNYKRAVGVNALTGAFDDNQVQHWYGAISVGTPAVEYTVDFDIGSADLFLPASYCDSTCNGHRKYDPSSSSTSTSLGKSFSILVDSEASPVYGDQYNDTVRIAGLTATNQWLGAVTKFGGDGFQASEFHADGVMGMAFQPASNYNKPPVFQTLVSEGQTSSPVFAFKFADIDSQLSIGGLDSSAYSGTPTYTNVTYPVFWQIAFSSLTVGGTSIVGGANAIVNSDTNAIITNDSNVKAFYAKIPGSRTHWGLGPGYRVFPCDSKLPTVEFTIGGKPLPMSSASLNLGPVSKGSKDCIGSIVAGDPTSVDPDTWILGYAFLRNYYTILDYGKKRVGFADLV